MSKLRLPANMLRHRVIRIVVWSTSMILAWLWFSTNDSPVTCINDGLDGVCAVVAKQPPVVQLHG